MHRLFTLAGAIISALTLSTAAFAQGGEGSTARPGGPVTTFELGYELYVGGIPFGQATMSARIEGSSYTATSSLQTEGIVNRFWQSKIETASTGVLDDREVRPRVYDSFSTRRSGGRQEVTLQFDTNGPAEVIANPAYDDPWEYEATEEQKYRSLDPLSAVIFLTTSHRPNDAEPCKATAPIFDGRRRYDVGFSFVERTDIRMDNGLYSGPALVCEVHYKQIAGYRQTLVEQGKRIPQIFAWVAPVRSQANPDRQFMVPLRLWAETEYGLVTIVANTLKVDGMTPEQAGQES